MQEDVNNLLVNSVDKVNRNNESITWQQGTKRRISSEITSPKIQKSGKPFTNTSMHSEREAVMDCFSGINELTVLYIRKCKKSNFYITNNIILKCTVEHCDENTGSSMSLFAKRKENSPLYSSSPRSIKKRILNTKHDHQYETSPTTTKKKCIQQQKRIQFLMKKTHI